MNRREWFKKLAVAVAGTSAGRVLLEYAPVSLRNFARPSVLSQPYLSAAMRKAAQPLLRFKEFKKVSEALAKGTGGTIHFDPRGRQ